MQSTYLKERLAKLAELKPASERIGSEENRKAIAATMAGGITQNAYPAMLGELMGRVMAADWDVSAALNLAERLEVIETQYERLVSIFESLELNMDESDLVALELMGKRTWTGHPRPFENSPYKSERHELSSAFNKAIAEVQESEREFEHEQATDALTAAGFVLNEDNEEWERGTESVQITMMYKNHVTNYAWRMDRGGEVDSGNSGDFRRLMALITPLQPVSASTVTETPTEHPEGPLRDRLAREYFDCGYAACDEVQKTIIDRQAVNRG